MYENALNSLNITQKYILKIILNKNRRFSSTLLFSESNVFSIRQLFAYQCLLWVFKNPSPLYEVGHIYYTRTKKDQSIVPPFCTKTHTQRFVFYFGPKLFNHLPLKIKQLMKTDKTTPVEKIKKNLKSFVKESFDVFCEIFK